MKKQAKVKTSAEAIIVSVIIKDHCTLKKNRRRSHAQRNTGNEETALRAPGHFTHLALFLCQATVFWSQAKPRDGSEEIELVA